MIKAIAYYRFSTERQDSSSIDAQRRNCEKFAAENGIEIVESFADEHMSGSNTFRPAYQAMLKALQDKGYKVLVANDLSRLHRDIGDESQFFKKMNFLDVSVLTPQGFDSSDPNAMQYVQFGSMINEYHRKMVSYQTKVAQKAALSRGGVVSGKSYGYDHRKDRDTRLVIREINKSEAEVVRQIFRLFDEGLSPLSIAEHLNEAGIPSPRGGKWRRSTIHGDPKDHSGILNNPLYNGVDFYGRGSWLSNPDNGKRTRKGQPRETWHETLVPHLRIVDPDLWARVKKRQDKISHKSTLQKASKGPRAGNGANPKYLLSGFLKCKSCGANLTLVNGSKYGCASRRDVGRNSCSFRSLVKRTEIEKIVIESFKSVLKPEALIPVVRSRFVSALKERSKVEPSVTHIRKELSAVTKKIANLTNGIKKGIDPSLFVDQLNTLAARQKYLTSQLATSGKLSSLSELEALAEKAADRVPEMYKAFADVLVTNIYKAREAIGLLCNNQIVVSTDVNGQIRIEKTALLGGFFRFSLGVPKFFDTPEIKLVAGAGFEPTTFGL
ncbi:recombinase family protein [Limnobacter sp.]|uniref:recombinase family protein n=1 Tax=Limnobacter sp. TaxID=2003368 RepID=UPI00374A1E0E